MVIYYYYFLKLKYLNQFKFYSYDYNDDYYYYYLINVMKSLKILYFYNFKEFLKYEINEIIIQLISVEFLVFNNYFN